MDKLINVTQDTSIYAARGVAFSTSLAQSREDDREMRKREVREVLREQHDERVSVNREFRHRDRSKNDNAANLMTDLATEAAREIETRDTLQHLSRDLTPTGKIKPPCLPQLSRLTAERNSNLITASMSLPENQAKSSAK